MNNATAVPLKLIIEAALFTAERPLTIEDLQGLFVEEERPPRPAIRTVLAELTDDCLQRGIDLVETASGFHFQTKASLTPWLKHLFTERPPRYSRALLETLAIIAYRQPITRHDIETIRGISVSTDIIKKLQDYNWIRILAHRDTPGHPALYGTTRAFLDHFNLKSLDELPTLAELRELNLQGDLFPTKAPEHSLINQEISDLGHQTTSIPGIVLENPSLPVTATNITKEGQETPFVQLETNRPEGSSKDSD